MSRCQCISMWLEISQILICSFQIKRLIDDNRLSWCPVCDMVNSPIRKSTSVAGDSEGRLGEEYLVSENELSMTMYELNGGLCSCQ